MSLILFCVLWVSWICVLLSHIIIWRHHQSLLLQIFLVLSCFSGVLVFLTFSLCICCTFRCCPTVFGSSVLSHPNLKSCFFFPVYFLALEVSVYIVSSLESLPLAVFSLLMSPSKPFFISIICFWSVLCLYFLYNFYLCLCYPFVLVFFPYSL